MTRALHVANADTPIGRAIVRAAIAADIEVVDGGAPRLDAVVVAPYPTIDDDDSIEAMSMEAFAAHVDRDLGATMRLLRSTLPALIAAKGSIVLIAIDGDVGDHLASEVSAGALATLAKSIAYQYGPEGLRANVVATPSTDDPTSADDIARLALFLTSPDASYMTGTVVRGDATTT